MYLNFKSLAEFQGWILPYQIDLILLHKGANDRFIVDIAVLTYGKGMLPMHCKFKAKYRKKGTPHIFLNSYEGVHSNRWTSTFQLYDHTAEFI